MIALICLLAFVGLSDCLEQLPTRREIEMSINRTIDEVERMVSADPSLPRLSRSQIVDILFNITTGDMDSYNDRVEKTREDYQRALMVVLPYSPKDTRNDSLNELFTKAPHIRIVTDPPESPESSRAQSTKSPNNPQSNSIRTDTKKTENRAKEPANHYKNHRDIYSEVSSEPPTEQALRKLLNNDRKKSQAPEKFTFNLASFDSSDREPSTSLPTLKSLVRNRVAPPSRSSLEIVYSTSVTESPITTKMVVHTTELSPRYQEPTMPPTRSTQNVLTSDQWRYNAPPSTTTMKPKRTTPEVIGSHQRPWTSMEPTPEVVRSHQTTLTAVEPTPEVIRSHQTTLTAVEPTLEVIGSHQRPWTSMEPTPEVIRSHQTTLTAMEPTPEVIRSHQTTSTTTKPNPDVIRSHQTTSTTMKPKRTTPEVIRSDQRPTSHHFLPTMMTGSGDAVTTHKSLTTLKTLVDLGSQLDMANLRILNPNEKPAPFYVTPMSSTSVTLEDSATTANTPVVSKTTPMREEVQTLLASIGLRPEEKPSDQRPNRVKQDQDKIFGSDFRIPESKDLITGQLGLEAVGVGSPSNQLSFDNAPQDVRQGVSNLSPEVQLLFQRFGLQTSGKEDQVVQTTTTLRPRPTTPKGGFWSGFKPLPVSEVKDEGMKDFLAKFGLGTVRDQKAMKERKSLEERPSLIEAVPGNMRQILENIGLIRKPLKPAVPKILVETTVTPQLHVFKPHETSLENEKQRTRINALLDTVKQVQEGKADAVAVQEAAKELLETAKSLKSGPDPLSLDEILKIYNDDLKNEIKRQQDPKDLAEMASSEMPETSTTTSAPDLPISSSSDSASSSSETGSAPVDFLGVDLSTDPKNAATEEPTTANPNLEALADSFGGSTAAPDPVLPTRRKTGLYFLVDWNTFLEVGEEGNDKVNLRFQPKVGDRTRFLPVTVP